MPHTAAYEYTHITWRKLTDDSDGPSVTNLAHVIHDRERAADEVRELMLNPEVFALRVVHYPNAEPESDTEHVTRIGPPVTI